MAYYSAKTAEFEHINQSGNAIDTKTGIIVAANLTVLALILSGDFLLTSTSQIILALLLINIEIGIWSMFVRNYDGPLSDASFKEDIQKGSEIDTMHQLIEDIDSYSENDLRIVKEKKVLFRWQITIMLVVLVTIIWQAVL